MRSVQISALTPDGARVDLEKQIPAVPVFDDAFLGFARGTLLRTTGGEVAIEDLAPGQRLHTSSGRAARVTWIGRTLFPGPTDMDRLLVRFMPDSYGEGRPNDVLTLGPAARILQAPPHLRSSGGHPPVLTPAHAFVDAVNVVEIRPPSQVELFHIGLDHHGAVQAAGLHCGSFHPAPDALAELSPQEAAAFLSLFPMIPDLAAFGAPRIPSAPEPER